MAAKRAANRDRARLSQLDVSPIVESEEVQPGIVLDFDAEHQVVGVEILRVRERAPSADLERMDLKVA